MRRHGKKFRAAQEKIEPDKLYQPREALQLLKELSFTKFDETVEAHVRTGLDPRHADQIVRGSAVLPHGTGRTQRVLSPQVLRVLQALRDGQPEEVTLHL